MVPAREVERAYVSHLQTQLNDQVEAVPVFFAYLGVWGVLLYCRGKNLLSVLFASLIAWMAGRVRPRFPRPYIPSGL